MSNNESATVVIGCLGLLGKAICDDLLSKGHKVIGCDIHSNYKVTQSLLNPNFEYLKLDINDDSSLEHLLKSDTYISGIVNSAYPRNSEYGKSVLDVSLESFNENTALNLGGAFNVLKHAANYFMKHSKPISVINISSIYGVTAPKFDIYEGTPMTMPVEYAAIKSALIHLGKYFVNYVNDSRFRVNSVSPGGLCDRQPQSFSDAYRKNTLGKGMLDAKDICGTVLFLLGEQSKFINGQNIIVDDGFTL
ncbi:oxidoreductase [Planctobacterium marinum]|uniref:oxidoreductase n=1 Tax=Planctobacterium marinum TaxID=1631968 RepID=UPI001E609B71|nr:oxidoreductase [Planctobacterium marinum]MCC2606132.1 SDR family oxidoreductase [Planctobacterium marinum]